MWGNFSHAKGRGARKTLPAALGHNLFLMSVCDLLKLLLTTLSFQAYAKIPKVGKRTNIAWNDPACLNQNVNSFKLNEYTKNLSVSPFRLFLTPFSRLLFLVLSRWSLSVMRTCRSLERSLMKEWRKRVSVDGLWR